MNEKYKLTLSGDGKWKKVTVRPVVIRERELWQFEYFDDKKSVHKNVDERYKDAELQRLKGLGHKIVKEEKIKSVSHDRPKTKILDVTRPVDFLVALGIQNKDGRIAADRYRKYIQIDEFLKQIATIFEPEKYQYKMVRVVDFGCGNGYLTVATEYYLREVLGLSVEMIAVDAEERPHWPKIKFVKGKIADVHVGEMDIAIALHACDTATDDALIKAVEGKAKYILAAPCCHKHVQQQLNWRKTEILAPLLVAGIIKERLGDLVTDTLRKLWLEMRGYSVDIVQWVDSEHSAKNLLIRAKFTGQSNSKAREEFESLKREFGVKVYLD